MRASASPDVDLPALTRALGEAVDGEVRRDAATRHAHATDASNYRLVPLAVVAPRTTEALRDAVAVCATFGAPVLGRGAGTSQAGQACNAAVLLDTSVHLTRILDLDPVARTATVEAGVVASRLDEAAARHGLRFGPDPSTRNRATIGGMIGNNACGVHTLVHGRTVDNVAALDVVLADGRPATFGAFSRTEIDAARRRVAEGSSTSTDAIVAALAALRDTRADAIRARFPTNLPRRVSGYNLDELLGSRTGTDDGGMHVGRLLVGSEGTLAITSRATVSLVDAPQRVVVLALGVASLADAGALVPELLRHAPTGLEGIDRAIAKGAPPSTLESLPDAHDVRTAMWLLVEFAADSVAAARTAAQECAASVSSAVTGRTIVTERDAIAALWRVRADGLGALVFAGDPPRVQGWEDAAVPPDRLGSYLPALDDLRREHGLEWGVYGHFGDGCVHTKIGFDLATGTGIATFRSFVEQAADLTVAHGGSLSGEHGDGRARAELLPRMFGAEVVKTFGAVKALFDPEHRLNPGVLVAPTPLDAHLRPRRSDLGPAPVGAPVLPFVDPTVVGERCVGMGVCRRDDDHGTMCPSWRVTRDERHGPRGRARLLAELGRDDREAGTESLTAEDVADALSLCLGCKACVSECPVTVDVPAARAAFADGRRRAGRGDGLAESVMARAHLALRLAARMPRVAAVGADLAARLALPRRVGITSDRPIPTPAPTTFHASWRRRAGRAGTTEGGTPTARAILFADTFTDTMRPDIAVAAARALGRLGVAVEVPPVTRRGRPVCCGRPLYDDGHLEPARRHARDLLDTLAPRLGPGVPLVVLEPGCLSALVHELPLLLPDDVRAHAVAEAAVPFGTALRRLAADDLPTISRPGREAVLHPHCQQDAVAGHADDLAVLRSLGFGARVLDAGCCGLAGGFGFGAGDRIDLSLAVAEDRFLPRLRAVPDDAVVVMDGWSCATQVDHLHGREVLHLAEVVDRALST